MTPDYPQPDLEERLATLQKLGATEFEPGERDGAERLQSEQDRISRATLRGFANSQQ